MPRPSSPLGADGPARFDPYATLNVRRDASRDEIKSAFLRLARTLHPDKQPHATQNGSADGLFVEVDRAWKVLGSPDARAVFDALGEEGLRMHEQVQLVQRRRVGPREVATVLTALRGAERERRNNVKSYIRAETTLEALKEFLELLLDRPEYATVPLIRGMSAQHAMDFDLGKDTVLTIVAVTGNRPMRKEGQPDDDEHDEDHGDNEHDDDHPHHKPKNGMRPTPTRHHLDSFRLMALGSLTAEITHVRGVDTFSFRLGGASVGSAFDLGMACERSFQLTKARVELVGGPASKDAGLEVFFTRTLNDSLEGSWRLGFGERAGISVGLHHHHAAPPRPPPGGAAEPSPGGGVPLDPSQDVDASSSTSPRTEDDEEDDEELIASRAMGATAEGRTLEAKCEVNPFAGVGLSLSWLESLSPRDKVRTSLTLGASGNEIEVESIRISYLHDSMRSLAVSLGLNGVYVKVRLGIAGRKFEVPIRLTPTPSFTHAFFAGLVPALIQHAVVAMWAPFAQRQRSREVEDLHAALDAARDRALKQTALMRPIAEARRKEQVLLAGSGAGGLVVLKATYGAGRYVQTPFWAGRDSPSAAAAAANMSSSPPPPPTVDVTWPLNFLVTPEGTLQLRAGSKARMMGFYHPAPGEPARLFIRFAYAQRVYEAAFGDEEEVHLPGDPRAVLIGTTQDHVNWSAA